MNKSKKIKLFSWVILDLQRELLLLKKENLKSEINNLKLNELYFETLPQLIHLSFICLNKHENRIPIRLIIGLFSASISFTLLLENTFKFYNVKFDYIFRLSRSIVNSIFLIQRVLSLAGALSYYPVIVLTFLTLRFLLMCLFLVYFCRKFKMNYYLFEITIGIIQQKHVYVLSIISFLYVYLETLFFVYLYLNMKLATVYINISTKIYSNSSFILESKIGLDQSLNVNLILPNLFIASCFSSLMWLVYFFDNKINAKKIGKLVFSNAGIQRKSIYFFIIPTDRILFQTKITSQNTLSLSE